MRSLRPWTRPLRKVSATFRPRVATDPTDLAYLSYYSGALRAIQIVDGELV